MCIGGPALIYYVTPTEEELFLRYNPELQRRSLERRQEKQEDFDNFVGRLKEYSRSEKPGESSHSFPFFLSFFFLFSCSDFVEFGARYGIACAALQDVARWWRVLRSCRSTRRRGGVGADGANAMAVWTAWEEDAARRRQLGVQAELDRRKQEAEDAKKLKQEMQDSLR